MKAEVGVDKAALGSAIAAFAVCKTKRTASEHALWQTRTLVEKKCGEWRKCISTDDVTCTTTKKTCTKVPGKKKVKEEVCKEIPPDPIKCEVKKGETLEDAVVRLSAYFAAKTTQILKTRKECTIQQKIYDTLVDKCNEETTKCETKKKDCVKLEQAKDYSTLDFSMKSKEICSDYNTCFNDAMEVFNKLVKDIKERGLERRKEWKGQEEEVCVTGKITKNIEYNKKLCENVTTITQEPDKCTQLKVEIPAWMNITLPVPPKKEPCDPFAVDCQILDGPGVEAQTVDDKPVPCKTKLDVVIALDSSGSLGSVGWKTSQEAAMKIVKMLDIENNVAA